MAELAHVRDVPGNRGGNGPSRARPMSACARPLPPNEVAVGSGDGSFARRDDVAIGAEAHGTAGLAPFEARVEKFTMQALAFRRAPHRFRSGNNPGANARRYLAPRERPGRLAQIRQASVGA